jgi:hypothetical protein
VTLENIIQSEISKIQKVNAVQFYFYEELRVVKLIESRLEVMSTWAEEGMGKLVFNDYNVLCLDHEVFLAMHSGDGCTAS